MSCTREPRPAGPEEAPAEAPSGDLKVAAVALEDEEAPPMAEEETAEPVKAKPTKASLCKLFSQMDAVEALVLVVGTLCAMAHGVAQPLLIVIFGDLIDALGGSPEEVQRETERLSLTMCAVGGGALVAATLQGACFKIFSDSQTMKFRIMYFQDILHQDVGWFDTKEVSALSAEIQDDLSKIQDAFGDKFGNGVMALSAFLGGFACAFGLGWLLALILSAVLPFMAMGTYFVGQAVAEVRTV
ncbi:ABCB5 [Symbiodinium microadriaticum]|nr:ABCB5 [Symbiodinium microadriaticum]